MLFDLSYRRAKKTTLRDARVTEQLERKQKLERERRAKQKHLDHLTEITTHGRDLTAAHRAHQAKLLKLGKTLLKFHADAEKDEQRRVERVSKERLKALRADDEEGYLKLIDTAKDTRITHLLRQTDAFLDSLATAVVAQQNDAVHSDNPLAAAEPMQVDEPAPGVVSESTFGAAPVFEEEVAAEKIDYYNVAHRIKETITEQPKMLVGGQLKSYQIKGLEWMISLYNNHVNGILADEMVRPCLSRARAHQSVTDTPAAQGLGKTIQTISLITFLIETKKQNGPFLVIVPLSTMPNWILEFEKWAPAVKMISYKGTPTQRKNSQWEIRQGGFQVLLTTYEYIIKDRPLLAKIKWVHMIIDEGHRMKNAQSKLSITLTTYYSSRYRLILTGTPLQVRPLASCREGWQLNPVPVANRTTCPSCGRCSTLCCPRSLARSSRSTSGSTRRSPTQAGRTRSRSTRRSRSSSSAACTRCCARSSCAGSRRTSSRTCPTRSSACSSAR